MNYEDFFPLGEHVLGEVSMDEMISEFMRKDIGFRSDKDALDYYMRAQSVLRDEILTCYMYLKEQGLLNEYHAFRDGE